MVNELLEATMAVSTNWLFKKMLKANFDNKSGRYPKADFLSFFKVDVENFQPIYFNGQKYDKALHENSYFIFLDSQFNIMGILKGNTHLKKKEGTFEKWESPRSYNFDKNKVINKNRKQLTEKATHILLITPEMMTRKIKSISNYNPKPDNHRRALKARLEEYKLKKNSVITHEQLMEMTRALMNHLTSNMFNHDAAREIAKKTKHMSWSYGPSELYRLISNVAEAADRYYEYFVRAEKYRNSNEEYKQYYIEDNEKQMEQYKLQLVDYHRAIMGA